MPRQSPFTLYTQGYRDTRPAGTPGTTLARLGWHLRNEFEGKLPTQTVSAPGPVPRWHPGRWQRNLHLQAENERIPLWGVWWAYRRRQKLTLRALIVTRLDLRPISLWWGPLLSNSAFSSALSLCRSGYSGSPNVGGKLEHERQRETPTNKMKGIWHK